jgi:hypothetical protein
MTLPAPVLAGLAPILQREREGCEWGKAMILMAKAALLRPFNVHASPLFVPGGREVFSLSTFPQCYVCVPSPLRVLYCRFSSAVYLFSVFIYASTRRHRRVHPPTSVYSRSLHVPHRLIRQRFLHYSVSGSPAAMVVLFMRHSCLLIPR